MLDCVLESGMVVFITYYFKFEYRPFVILNAVLHRLGTTRNAAGSAAAFEEN